MGKNKSKKRKQRKQIPVTSITKQSTKQRLVHRKRNRLIAEVHKINKGINTVKSNKNISEADRIRQLADLQRQKDELGGIAFYQHVSKKAEKHYGNYNTSRWVIQKLKETKVLPINEVKISLLDVGALDMNYENYEKWITWTAIDLNPQKPGIRKANLLKFKVESQIKFDVIVLSLVLNFEGDLQKRGEMLKKAITLYKLGGCVFIMLPLACLENSRYLSSKLLDKMMTALGCNLTASENTRKLSLRMYTKTDDAVSSLDFAKRLLRNGEKLNNFCIILKD